MYLYTLGSHSSGLLARSTSRVGQKETLTFFFLNISPVASLAEHVQYFAVSTSPFILDRYSDPL